MRGLVVVVSVFLLSLSGCLGLDEIDWGNVNCTGKEGVHYSHEFASSMAQRSEVNIFVPEKIASLRVEAELKEGDGASFVLLDPKGKVVWETELSEADSEDRNVNRPLPGDWTAQLNRTGSGTGLIRVFC